jgi:cytochrome b561
LFDLPQLRIAAQLPIEEGHEALFNVLPALAVIHIAAALKHHFFNRDNVLRSMLPWSSRPRVR